MFSLKDYLGIFVDHILEFVDEISLRVYGSPDVINNVALFVHLVLDA